MSDARVLHAGHSLRLNNAGHYVTVHRVAGKRHGMISGPAEMRPIMEFWAERLGRRPLTAGPGEELLEVS